jgi:hypothetical protein
MGEIDWLKSGAARNSQLKRSAATFGVDDSRAVKIVRNLADAGLLVPFTANVHRSVRDDHRDIPSLSVLRTDGDGLETLQVRSAACVAINETGRIGSEIAMLLAQAGIGQLLLPDNTGVQRSDLGHFGMLDVDRPRLAALRRRLRDLGLTTAFVTSGAPDLVVSIEQGTQVGHYFSALVGLAVPHLSIAVTETVIEVGPFVLPNKTACINCLQLHRADADPSWPVLVSELGRLKVSVTETTLSTLAAAIAAAQVLAFVDGGKPSLVNSLATISLPEALPSIGAFEPHSNCGCQEELPFVA